MTDLTTPGISLTLYRLVSIPRRVWQRCAPTAGPLPGARQRAPQCWPPGNALRGRRAEPRPTRAGIPALGWVAAMLSLAVVFQPAPAGAQESGATVSSVVFTSPAKTYAIGDTIEVTVTFSEAVTVTEAGTDKPQIEIDVGGTPRQAEYESGTGTAALVFGYTVAAGDADSDGIAIGADKLTTPGASAIQASGTDASLRHSAVVTDATRTVDGVPLPAITIAGGEEVTEGVAAVFTLSRTGDAAEALTVTVEVQQEFAVTVSRVPDKLFGEPPTTVTFDAGHATASLSLPTVDDALPDHDVVVTVAIGAGPNYSPGPSAATATVLVREDDPLIVRPVFTVLEGPDAGNPVPPDFANGLAEGTTFAVGISTETNGLLGGSVTFEIRLVEGTATDPEDVSLPFGFITSYTAHLRRTALMIESDFRQRPDGTFFHKTTARIVVSIKNDGITEPNETFSIQVVPVSAEWPATVESSKTAILQAVIGDTTPPSLVTTDAVTVDGTTLTVTFDEALDPASVPPGSAFTVTVGGTAVALASTDPVAVRGRTVTLTLASAVPPGDAVTVSYRVPTGGGARPVQDTVGNDAVGFSDAAATNATRTHYAQGFTTGTHAHGYTLTSVGLDFTSPFAPVVEVWAADGAGLPWAVLWRLDPRRGDATMFDAAAGSKLDANTTYFVYASFGGPPGTNDIVFAGGDSPSGWTIVSDRYERSQLNAGAWALSGAEQALRIKLEATALSAPGAAAGEPADADVSWKTSFTVGNLMRQGYREWERGYRRQWCIERQVEDDPEHIEDRSNADWCYGAIADQNFVVDGTTYELEGVYHYTAERNDQLNVDFTEEVDLSALAGREFVINGVTFAVNDRSGNHSTRGNSLVWAAPQWTASMGWTVGSTIWVGLKTPPASTAQTAPAAAVTRTGEGPVHGPFDVRVAFSEDMTGFEAADISAENGAVVADSFTAVDARTWTAQIAPAASGTVSVSVPADAAHAGQIGNTASDALTVEADLSVPAVTVTRRAEVPVAGPFSVRVTFSKAVTGFAIADLSVEGGTATGLVSPTGETWHDVLIAPSDGAAAIAVLVPAGVVEDLAGRPNGASETLRIAVAGARFTARFEELPESHDGVSAFSFELHFSETPEDLSFRTVASDLLDVAGAEVTGARRHTPGSNQGWIVSVRPTQDGDVTISLPARDCGETHAVCVGGEPLAQAVSKTVPRTPLTASFEEVPAEHDRASAFTVELRFSEAIAGLSYRTLQDRAVTVTNGSVTKARRLEQGANRRWAISIAPQDLSDVTVSLPATTDCDAAGAICTSSDRMLSSGVTATVRGPLALAVEDARAEEGTDATIDFTVTLNRAASVAVTVDYATADGSAHAGVDYTAASGTLTFQAGESSQTVEVSVLDDSHDEGEETLTLTLSNAVGGRVADAEATGTIENTDPLPRALLARFGRATALHVMEQVEERLEASRAPGFRGRFAGRELRRGMEREMGRNFLSRLQSTAVQGARDTTGVHGDLGGAELLRMGLGGGGDLLTGSRFVLNRETGQGGSVSLWSRGMESRFSGREGELSLDGGVRTTMLGADYAKGPLMAGLLLSHRRGVGGYQGADVGEVASSVTGLHPWVGYQVTDRVTLWGVTGYGKGSLSLTPGETLALPTPSLTSLQSGLSMSMLAGGVRGELVDGGVGHFGLAFKADALWVGTGSEAVDGPAGRLAATEAVVTRVRTALEASQSYVFGHGIALRPSLEVGLRRDGGDAETGAGADIAGSLIASDPLTGLSVDVRVRTLLVHEAEGFRERGVSVSFSYDPTPSTPLGLTARVAPSWGGQARSGAEALWGRETMEGMGAGSPGSGDGLDAELGYALPVGSQLVGTPRFGVTTSEFGRDYRLGYSLAVVQGGAMSFQFGLDAQRRESLGRADAEHSLVGRVTASW